MQIPHIKLDKTSDLPLYRQLSDALMALIAKGKLEPDTKLPSIRQMAQSLDVNNTTVVSAYKYLERMSAVYSVIGSGTFIATQAPTQPDAPQPGPVPQQNLEQNSDQNSEQSPAKSPEQNQNSEPTQEPIPAPTPIAVLPETPSHIENIAEYINFADTTTDANQFPVTAFRRSFDAVLDRDRGFAFDCHDTQGYKPLRESFCHLMNGFSVKLDPETIHVISDALQGLQALAAALVQPGDTVFVEKLTSQSTVAVFASRGANIVEMPLAKDGLDLDALEVLLKHHRPKLLHVMPNFQAPTGIAYSNNNMRHLLQMAKIAGAYIIEEDHVSDFYYDGIKKSPLKAFDDAECVYYIKSFAKTLVPGLRIGFIACPHDSLAPKIDLTTSGYIQRGVDLFLRSGAYDLHLANMRSVYGRRYHKVVTAINTYLPNLADVDLPGGGLCLWIRPRNTNSDIDYVEQLLQQKIIVSPGQLFAISGEESAFRISFAAVSDERIAEGIGGIASVLQGE